ncbi:MAG: methyltransferase [candidate division NC10 bacterium]|nr:methyltransferase [candidate division NC10 bacterium]
MIHSKEDMTVRYRFPQGVTVAVRHYAGVCNPTAYSVFVCSHLPVCVGIRCLDVGAGSGIVGLTMAKLGAGKVDAVELEQNAKDALNTNVRLNGLIDKVRVIIGDAFKVIPDEATYDLIACNPPSLPMARPPAGGSLSMCCYGGMTGIEFIADLVHRITKWLRPGGSLLFVNTSLADLGTTQRTLKKAGFRFEIVAWRQLRFRKVYEQHIAWIRKREAMGKAIVLSRGGHLYELLFLIRAYMGKV